MNGNYAQNLYEPANKADDPRDRTILLRRSFEFDDLASEPIDYYK